VFHAGAGQLYLEQGFTAFQYQQEQIEHVRFDTCLGVDCWTAGQVKRLPDTTFFDFGFNATVMCTATVAGVDYAIIGGVGWAISVGVERRAERRAHRYRHRPDRVDVRRCGELQQSLP